MVAEEVARNMQFAQLIVQRYDAAVAPGYRPDGVTEMLASGHPVAEAIGRAIAEVAGDVVCDSEAPFVAAIEARRRELEASSDEISYRDFGAATRDSDQTPGEMYEGVARKRTLGDLCRRTSKPYRSGLLLMKLVEALKPTSCLELGACLGISASYQASALQINGSGKLVTLEGADAVAAVAKQTLARHGHGRVHIHVGRFQDTLDAVLGAHGPFDYTFIDGHHDGPATIDYADRLSPFLTEEACVIYDDIRWSEGMLRAWDELRQRDTVDVAVDLVDIGVCCLKRSGGARLNFSIT